MILPARFNVDPSERSRRACRPLRSHWGRLQRAKRHARRPRARSTPPPPRAPRPRAPQPTSLAVWPGRGCADPLTNDTITGQTPRARMGKQPAAVGSGPVQTRQAPAILPPARPTPRPARARATRSRWAISGGTLPGHQHLRARRRARRTARAAARWRGGRRRRGIGTGSDRSSSAGAARPGTRRGSGPARRATRATPWTRSPCIRRR